MRYFERADKDNYNDLLNDELHALYLVKILYQEHCIIFNGQNI